MLLLKHGKYDASFIDTNYFFGAMVFETLGAINAEGEDILRQVFRFVAKHLCDASSLLIADELGARMSCNLQRSISQAILVRMTDKSFGKCNQFIPEPFEGRDVDFWQRVLPPCSL